MTNILKIILSNIYKLFIYIRNRLFDIKVIKTFRLSIPVISVGNISVGGTGKTPFCIYLANLLLENNRKPALIAKGYKRKNKKINIVSDGHRIFCDVESAGDESILIAEKVHIPIVIHDKKYKAAKIAAESFEIDCLIIDDGFQHRKLQRDIDIILLNDDNFNNDKLLPAGKLRETLNSINRADIIVIPENFNNFNKLKQYKPNNIIKIRRYINNIYNLSTLISISINELSNNKIILLSAIASPQQFELMVKDLGLNPNKHFSFGDHHYYSHKDIDVIVKFCQANQITSILTTEKDAVKLKKYHKLFAENKINLYVCQMEIFITEGFELLQRKLNEVFEKYSK